ncbi:rSAM-modified peptide [Flavobacterium bizetiae]
MANIKLNISDFEAVKLSKKQQKTISGGGDPIDPNKGDGKGNTRL